MPDEKPNAIEASHPVRPIEILLVEDSPTDALLAKEALTDSTIANRLHHVTDGVEAMAFLHRQGSYKDVPRPDLILLDLNMPRKDGREVLAETKADDQLKRIPVIVLTTSAAESDIHTAYGNFANCYVVKPVDFQKFSQVVRVIEGFWFVVVTLPCEG